MLHIPKNFHGELFQFMVSHEFIMEYVNPRGLKNGALHNIIHSHKPDFFSLPDTPAPIHRKMSHIIKKLSLPPSTPLNKLRILQKTGGILDLFFRMHLGKEQVQPTPKSRENAILQAARFLDTLTHASFPGIEFLAYRFGLSLSGLKRGFKDKYGTTPHKYYRHKQIKNACHLLQATRLPIKEVAEELGFDTSGNFIRAFKAETGTTPGRFREKCL